MSEDVRESRDEEQPRIDEDEAQSPATRAEAQAEEEEGGEEDRVEADATMGDRQEVGTNPDEGPTQPYPPKPA